MIFKHAAHHWSTFNSYLWSSPEQAPHSNLNVAFFQVIVYSKTSITSQQTTTVLLQIKTAVSFCERMHRKAPESHASFFCAAETWSYWTKVFQPSELFLWRKCIHSRGSYYLILRLILLDKDFYSKAGWSIMTFSKLHVLNLFCIFYSRLSLGLFEIIISRCKTLVKPD